MAVVDPAFISALQACVSPDRVLTRDEDVLPYSFDGTAALKQRPGAVVFPLNTAEVAACVKLARDRSVPVVPEHESGVVRNTSRTIFSKCFGFVHWWRKLQPSLSLGVGLPFCRMVICPGGMRWRHTSKAFWRVNFVGGHRKAEVLRDHCCRREETYSSRPVSYNHLTLPTILRVEHLRV